MRALKIALVAAALGAAVACTGSASAMPVGGLAAASNELANDMVQTCAGAGGIDAGDTRAITPIDPTIITARTTLIAAGRTIVPIGGWGGAEVLCGGNDVVLGT